MTSNKLKEKICFTLKMHYFLQQFVKLEHEKVNKVFLRKKQTNLVKSWLGGAVRGLTGRQIVGKHIKLCDTDTAMLLIIVTIIDT